MDRCHSRASCAGRAGFAKRLTDDEWAVLKPFVPPPSFVAGRASGRCGGLSRRSSTCCAGACRGECCRPAFRRSRRCAAGSTCGATTGCGGISIISADGLARERGSRGVPQRRGERQSDRQNHGKWRPAQLRCRQEDQGAQAACSGRRRWTRPACRTLKTPMSKNATAVPHCCRSRASSSHSFEWSGPTAVTTPNGSQAPPMFASRLSAKSQIRSASLSCHAAWWSNGSSLESFETEGLQKTSRHPPNLQRLSSTPQHPCS